MKSNRPPLCLILGMISLQPALADEPAPGGAATNILVFEPAFFAEARPTDAYDMVRRIPGFTLAEGDDEVRGYAGATGNVLIDGKPPARKQESLEALLRRIPASGVDRIELVRGGGAGIDTGGHAVVVNIVRKRTSDRNVAAEAGASIASDHVLRPNLRLEASRQSGDRRVQGALALTSEVGDESGDGDLVVSDAGGSALERSDRREWETIRTLAADGEVETPLGAGALSANASLTRERTRATVDAVRSFPDSANEASVERETLLSGETGARYRLPVGPGDRIELLLIQRLGRLRALSTSVEGEDREQFSEATDTSETIGRVGFRRERASLAIDFAVEAALNRLESEARLEEDGAAVPLPGSDAVVEERRAEASAGATWRIGPRLTVEPSLRVETSTIGSTGGAARDRSFLYWKPRLAASRDLEGGQLRLELVREVGQLDFEDFVASASLERDEVTAGAVSLRPSRSWSLSAAYERRFWSDGAIVLSYRHDWIADVVDRVLVVADGEAFDAVGNIGDGSRHSVQVELSAPLDRLRLKGATLKSSLTVRKSSVTDPITGESRSISEEEPIEGEVRFSHDLLDGRFSWGLDAELGERQREYRFDEVRTETEGPRLSAFAEYRPAPDWRLRIEAANLTSRTIVERRETHDGPRSSGDFDEVERRAARTTPTLLFTVRKSFASPTGG